MALMEWNEDFSVQVAEIDRQHRKLVEMINELNAAMGEGRGKSVVGKIIDGLVGYTKTHFTTEEDYFSLLNYPERYSHQKEHEAFVAKVSEFKQGFEEGRIALSIEVMNFLSDWLRNHIKGADKKYSAFFNAKGLR